MPIPTLEAVGDDILAAEELLIASGAPPSSVRGRPAGPRLVPAAVAPPEYTKRAVFAIVLRRCGPHLIEASVIPAVLFYSCLLSFGLGAAYLAAITWAYAAVGRRVLGRRPVPGILILGVIGITARTVVAVTSGSSFVYFLQPVLGTVAMGCVFLASLGLRRPLIGRLANDFWPLTPEMVACPGVVRLFRHLTLLWAAVNLGTAAMTMSLLVSLPLAAFLAVKQLSGLAVTAGAVFLTISLSVATARREGFAGVPSPRPATVFSEA